MTQKKLWTVMLLMLLTAGIVGIVAAEPAASNARSALGAGSPAAGEQASAARSYLPRIQAEVGSVPGWQQVNVSGFSDPQTDEVSAVAAFDSYLYAGTSNAIAGASILRSADGLTWTAVTQPGFGNPHDTAPPAILDLAVFNGRLYAGTGRGNAAQIWRTLNGLNWAPVVSAGFGIADIVAITALVEYGGKIYAGVTNEVTGAQIWSSFTGDSNSWTQVAPATPGTEAARVTGFAVFGEALYAAVELESGAPAQIWRSYGADWTTIVNDGFGDSHTTTTGAMAVFDGYLYVGAGSTVSGAQLWRTNDGTTWQQGITPAFGDANNQQIEMASLYQNQLYVSTRNTVTGMEIWRSTDGALWEQANLDGFGDSNNAGTNQSNATADYLGGLFVGTSNTSDGGELWQLPCSAPLVTALRSGGTIQFTWTDGLHNVYRAVDDPYFNSGEQIGNAESTPFNYVEGLLGNSDSNAFYLVGTSLSCGRRLGEFDFRIVAGTP